MTLALPAAPDEWPPSNGDFDFYYQGLRKRRLLVQRCDLCQALRFPPGPMCGSCGSLAWSPHACSGKGRVYSYTVQHHPAVPPYDSPHAMALVDLEEGVRMALSFAGEDLRIGTPVQVGFVSSRTGVTLPIALEARA